MSTSRQHQCTTDVFVTPTFTPVCDVIGRLDGREQVVGEVPQEEVELSLLKKGVGPVTQSDVEAAALAQAPIFALNVGNVSPNIKVVTEVGLAVRPPFCFIQRSSVATVTH